MNIPPEFQFSQGSLQDFVDCRRRFLLRHIFRLSWPAIETQPALERERYMQQGSAFHRLAQQYLLGIPQERLAAMIHDADLEAWWQHFMQIAPGLKQSQVSSVWRLYPEISLSAPLKNSRLVAKYDLVAVSPQGNLLIYDWKTTRSRPRRQWLESRLQTRVYPYLLVRSGSHLNHNQPLPPEQIEMVYWFAAHPGHSERFPYSAAAYQADEAYLTDLVETVQALDESEFYLTSDEKRCAYCTYRSLCSRGISAGSLSEMEDEILAESAAGVDFDFEQIAEIEF